MDLEKKMFVWLLILGSVFSTPIDEFKEFVNHGIGDISRQDVINDGLHYNVWLNLLKLNSENGYFKLVDQYIKNGTMASDLTFSIYDDNLRGAAIALFRLFQNTVGETFEKVREWAKKNINTDMYMYALRLESVYSSKTDDSTLLPPFIWNPRFFVNAESISKASIMASDIANYADIFNLLLKRNSSDDIILKEIINSNYSGWNLHSNKTEDLLNYFREDISLNSYYLGIHFLFPFWMADEELEYVNPRFAEHYLYALQQLIARYNLEKLHIRAKDSSYTFDNWEYVPYLRYKNGLPFPTRPCVLGNWSIEEAYLKNIDTDIRELISIGYSVLEHEGAVMNDQHINILAKLIRATVDGTKYAKTIRDFIAYGTDASHIHEYNPAPSVLHHPETSLKDPVYWFLIEQMKKYFTELKNAMEPLELTQYESEEFKIVYSDFSNFTTFFDYYYFPVNYALSNVRTEPDWMDFLEVTQRRLKCAELSLKFRVASKVDKTTVVRLYLGPRCNIDNCWKQYDAYFELDTFYYPLKKGINNISWSPKSSNRFSYDDYYNSFLQKTTPSTKFSIYRFPENLLIPRGLENGLNLTLFVMITPKDSEENNDTENFHSKILTELDSKPLGFPFHRRVKGYKDAASNYKFYNVSVYHRSLPVDLRGYFSPHLY